MRDASPDPRVPGVNVTRAAALGARALLLLFVLLHPCTAVGQQDDAEQQPIGVGLTEQVEVELVLVDFLVLDAQGRNVPGLGLDDFALKVGGRKTPIASIDVDCRLDGTERGDTTGRPGAATPGRPAEPPRRIVLVFDYYHITNVAETIDRALEMLDRWPRGGEVHTVISLGRSVRVEAPPTTDLGDVRWALQRMRSDPDLYAIHDSSLTQYPFFDRMKALFDLLEQPPGRKAVVLFSGPFQADAFLHDPEFSELSGRSTTTRTSIYPVDTGGLRTDLDPAVSPLGGPPELRRLANNTGGRITADTSDIGLAYAQAHSDLGCTYTLGFYNNQPRLDRRRRLTIKVRQPNLRLVYPEFYLERSPEEHNKSMFATATMTPHMFESDEVATDLFVLGPASSSRWRTVLAVEARLEPGPAAEDIELRGFLRKPNGTIVYEFKEQIPRTTDTESRTFTFFQEIEVEPGRYVVSAVLFDPAQPAPRAATRSTELVRIPSGSPFLIGPILGRPADPESADRRRPRAPAFEPSLVLEAHAGEPLHSLTLLCVTGANDPSEIRQLARRVTTTAGSPVEAFDTDTVRLSGQGRTHCEEFLDVVATSSLAPGRYEISASAETADRRMEGGAVEFTVLAGPE